MRYFLFILIPAIAVGCAKRHAGEGQSHLEAGDASTDARLEKSVPRGAGSASTVGETAEQDRSASRVVGDEMTPITAQGLLYAFQADENEANRKYKGKVAYVAGYVTLIAGAAPTGWPQHRHDVSLPENEDPYVTMGGLDDHRPIAQGVMSANRAPQGAILCRLNQSEKDRRPDKGTSVQIRGHRTFRLRRSRKVRCPLIWPVSPYLATMSPYLANWFLVH